MRRGWPAPRDSTAARRPATRAARPSSRRAASPSATATATPPSTRCAAPTSTCGAASSRRSWARRAPASRRSCTSSPASTAPRRARIAIDGQEIGGLKDRELTQLRRDKVGFIFQSFNLLPTLTAEENIALPLTIAGRKPDARWFDQLVETVGLTDRLGHKPSELSGGQQQRVAVARALVSRPAVVFADEPTGNLDSRTGAEVLQFLRRSVDDLGQTIVMVTHDADAAAVADRVLFLQDGEIVQDRGRMTRGEIYDVMKSLEVQR